MKVEAAEHQLEEVEVLQSVFSGEDELSFSPEQVATLRSLIDGGDNKSSASTLSLSPVRLCLWLRFEEGLIVRLEAELPLDYPDVPPQLDLGFLSTDSELSLLSRQDERDIKQRLIQEELATNLWTKGQPSIFSIALWLQEHVSALLQANLSLLQQQQMLSTNTKTKEDAKEEKLIREWLWFHHIYSKKKRKHIVEWARELQLTGCSMVGKPGVVCVEGREEDVKEYVQRLRGLSWQKMTSRFREELLREGREGEEGGERKGEDGRVRKWRDFKEVVLSEVGENGGGHQDLGDFSLYLKGMGLDYVFSHVFGVGGVLSRSS
ncbi:RWD domain-containing protein 2B [Balamuthia mandrillaris]